MPRVFLVFLPSSFGGRQDQGLRIHTISALAPALHQPSVYGRSVDPNNAGDDRGTFAALHAPRRAHRFQGLMIKLLRVVFFHAGGESISIHAVKRNIELLVNGLIRMPDRVILQKRINASSRSIHSIQLRSGRTFMDRLISHMISSGLA
jgi:hypothetical protein